MLLKEKEYRIWMLNQLWATFHPNFGVTIDKKVSSKGIEENLYNGLAIQNQFSDWSVGLLKGADNEGKFDFLKDLVANIADIGNDEDEGGEVGEKPKKQ